MQQERTQQEKTQSRPKPRLSFWQIWNMSFGFLGIQFGFGLQTANTSRIFETLGAAVDEIPILWLAAPITGLLVQPLIGFYSDRTWTRLGRRRPYFLVGAILASLALLVMPNSPMLWVAAGMLWIMDTAFNVAMEPFRAFVGDNLPSEQRTMGFAMQSFFIGVGAVVASSMPYILTEWFGVSNSAPEGIIPDSVKWSFYAGAVAFMGAILWTVLRSKEYAPEDLAAFEAHENEGKEVFHVEVDTQQLGKRQVILGGVVTVVASAFLYFLYSQEASKDLYILTGAIIFFGLLLLFVGFWQSSNKPTNTLATMMNDFYSMPKTMKQLAIVQFFSWFALFAMWIYTTSAVTKHLFGATDNSSDIYNEGANFVGIAFAVYNGVAALAAFFLPIMAKRFNRKITHAICLVLGGLGIGSVYFISEPNMLLVSMVGVGFAWASILSMPYAILTGSLPASKMGYYMGVFNFFIVVPQMVAASILGFIIGKYCGGDAIYAMLIGGVSYLLAAVFTLLVEDE